MDSFVQLLSSDLNYLVESSFYLSYYTGMQPSEIDNLSTYEFNTYTNLLRDQIEEDREYNLKLAQIGSVNSIFR